MSNHWISDRLRELRKSKGSLAKALGIDPARVSEIIGGRRNVQVAELPLMADFLGLPTDDLVARLATRRQTIAQNQQAAPTFPIGPRPDPLGHDGYPVLPIDLPVSSQIPRNLPIYGSAMGGPDGAFEMNGQVMDYAERPPSLAAARNAYGIYVQGDSMSPRFEAGWLLHVNPSRPVRKGDNVVVQIRAADEHSPPLAYIKTFDCLTPSKLVLRQFNPACTLEWPSEDVVSIHRVVGIAEM